METLPIGSRGHSHTQPQNIPSRSLLWFYLGFLPGFDWEVLFSIHFQDVDLLLGSRYREYLEL